MVGVALGTPVAVGGIVCGMLGILAGLGCGGSGSDDEARSEPGDIDQPGVTLGFINRDEPTVAAIESTADTRLPAGRGDSLELVVTKSRYRLDVVLDGETLKTYPVALGGEPLGPKQAEGDERTPEGEYTLIPHHPSPSFGGCFYVCYPNGADADRGLSEGLIDRDQGEAIAASLRDGKRPPYRTALGGLILVHGTKRRWIKPLTRTNWTNGCIAMENAHLLELLDAFDDADRPVLSIRP